MSAWRLWIADTVLKLKMLWLYGGSFRDWYTDVWRQDPDEQMCCSGYECGCYGAWYADMWETMWKNGK